MLEFVRIPSHVVDKVNWAHSAIFLVLIVTDHHQLTDVVTLTFPGVPIIDKGAAGEAFRGTYIVRNDLPVSGSQTWL